MNSIHLSPPPEPFRWEISLVSATEGESPAASLPDKAPFSESSVEPPAVVTSPSPSTKVTPPEEYAPRAPESTAKGNTVRASNLVSSTTADKLYQVVGPDGSVSFTNVPADSTYQEKHLDSGLLSTVHSTSALKTDATGLSPRPDSVAARANYAWIWDIILRRMVEATNSVCYRVDAVQGRVVVKLRIDENGYMSRAQVVQSSGHAGLDQNILEILRHINPVTLPRPLGRRSVWL